jgi:hypothetical protein
MTEKKKEAYLRQHAAFVRQLQNIVKGLGCSILLGFGTWYVANPLLNLPHSVANVIEYAIIAFVAFMVVLVVALFKDISDTMLRWLNDLPLWENAKGIAKRSWARGIILFWVLPFVPLLFFLSAVNQCVRRRRGLAQRPPSSITRISPDDASSEARAEALANDSETQAGMVSTRWTGYFTWRIEELLRQMLDWDHIAIIQWIYVFGFLLIICYSLSTLLLKVFLAYLSLWFESWKLEFPGIVACTFFIGLFLFLLPPVPGMLVYIFSGALFPRECPGPHGFFIGAAVSIAMGFVLKLIACAMQQKLIGEQLGKTLWVRQQVGIHTPAIRTIEAVLRKPGFSLGKVAILVGGPDWPTSVLCGILKLPLMQILIGTVPIIGFIAPFSLTGSLMFQASEVGDDSDMWKRWASVMSVVSFLVGTVLWLIVAWTTQAEYEKNHVQLMRPKVEYIDLDWCDHRSQRIRQECRVLWGDVPLPIKLVLVTGLLSILGASHLYFFAPSICFRSFSGTGDISNLQWFGNDGVFKFSGQVGLILAAVSSACLLVFHWWCRAHVRTPLLALCKILDADEAEWKLQRL